MHTASNYAHVHGASPAARADGYARRKPEDSLLYQVVREHWPVFRDRAAERGGLPKFVEREFDEFLSCGLLERGLVRLACRACGQAMVVAFSCKRRGFCPSCLGRRMSDLASHLCDEVLPEVPVRQWVCSLPWRLRYAMGFDRRLCADVLGAFIGALERSLRWRAKRELGLRSVRAAHTGALTFVQRSDASLRLNVHFHTLALDGVYVRAADRTLAFHALAEPTAQDVAEVAAATHRRLLRVLERHGRSRDEVDDAQDSLALEEPVLASCYAASAGDVQLLGAEPGQRTRKLARPRRLLETTHTEALAEVGGVNVHANVMIDGRDRARLERLCRYIARPPLAQDRLELHHDGRLRYGFKRPWKDGTHAVLLDPLDLIGRLCTLVPPPRFHMLRYHGVLGSNAKLRSEIVASLTPAPDLSAPPAPVQLPLLAGEPAPSRPTRHPWAWLLRRVFSADVSVCSECAGKMRIVEIATDARLIARVLHELGLGPRPPPRPRPALPGQLPLPFQTE